MANWTTLATTDGYAAMVAAIDGRDTDSVRMLDPTYSSPSNLPTGAVRWNPAGPKWEHWVGGAWSPLAETYAINITGTVAAGAGSGASPSVAVSTGAGVFSPGTGLVGLAGGGVERMRFSASGKMSVGAGPTPVGRVTVAGGGFAVQESASNQPVGWYSSDGLTTYGTVGVDSTGAASTLYLNCNDTSGKVSVQIVGSEKLAVDSYGRLYGKGLHNNSQSPSGSANQYVASGSFVPTNVPAVTSGVSGLSITTSSWVRVGNVVTLSGAVAGSFSVTAGSAAFIGLTIPIGIVNFGPSYGVATAVFSTQLAWYGGPVDIYDATTLKISLLPVGGTSGSFNCRYSFTYYIGN